MTEVKVSRKELVEELEKELAYHLDGGNTYRQDTARYSLGIAKVLPEPYILFERQDAYIQVQEMNSELDEDRLKDVSKMLSVILRDMHRKKNMSSELKELLKNRKESRKPLSVKTIEINYQTIPHISKSELVEELERELAYHLDGGTTYRQETARVSLAVAHSLLDTEVLFKREDSYEKVKELLPELDEERLMDVSKMLSVIVRDLLNRKTLPDKIVKAAEAKMKNFKGLKFKQ